MAVRVKARVLFTKLKVWWKSSKYKRLDYKVEAYYHGNKMTFQTVDMLIKDNHDEFKKESALRKSQATKLLKKLNHWIEQVEKSIGDSNENFRFMNEKMKKLDPHLKKMDELDNYILMVKNELKALVKTSEKFVKLEDIRVKVQADYDRYLSDLTEYHQTHIKMLHQDISEYKKNDNAVVRLASLETRITLLEGKSQVGS